MKTRAVWAAAAACLFLPNPPANRPGEETAPAGVELLTLRSRIFSNTRFIRVWLPPGYHQAENRARRYPVFYFTDGVAAFDGRKLDIIAGELVRAGKIPPTLFVGVDNGGSTRESRNPGSDRAREYLPFPDDTLVPAVPAPQGKRFPAFLETEVRPLVESRYRANGEIGLAGASYGGAIAVYTALENPGRYKWLLIESPSLYIADHILLRRAESFRQWPERVYTGAGTNEGRGDASREMVDDASRFMRSVSASTEGCLLLVPGAVHSEEAWRARLPAALGFLLGHSACPASLPNGGKGGPRR